MNIMKKVKRTGAGKQREAAAIGIIGLTEEQREQQDIEDETDEFRIYADEFYRSIPSNQQ